VPFSSSGRAKPRDSTFICDSSLPKRSSKRLGMEGIFSMLVVKMKYSIFVKIIRKKTENNLSWYENLCTNFKI